MRDTILVTGGAGFLGSHVVDCLLQAGNAVIVMDDLSGGFLDNIHPDAEFIQGSIVDHQFVDRVFDQHEIRYVYHLAAYAAEGLSHFIKRFNYQNNLIGSVNVINNCINHDVDCLVFASSIAVYGASQVPMHEDRVPEPEDPYGIAKLAVEQELRACSRMFGLNHAIFRPHNVYGERQNIGDPYRNVIGIFMNQLMKGEPMTIFGDGTQTRAFTYVKDIAPVMAQAHLNERAYGQVFNVGADTSCDLNHLAGRVAAAMGQPSRVKHLPARKEVMHAHSSHERVRAWFQCPPDTALDVGLASMAGWVKKAGARQGVAFSDIEIERGLPPSWRPFMPV